MIYPHTWRRVLRHAFARGVSDLVSVARQTPRPDLHRVLWVVIEVAQVVLCARVPEVRMPLIMGYVVVALVRCARWYLWSRWINPRAAGRRFVGQVALLGSVGVLALAAPWSRVPLLGLLFVNDLRILLRRQR